MDRESVIIARAPRAFLLCFIFFVSSFVMLPSSIAEEGAPVYLAEIRLHTSAELKQLLRRADSLYRQGATIASGDQPVAFILHGAEARVFLKDGYSENRPLVDLAAKLTALSVVEIRVCETWLGGEGLKPEDLLPFVDTVENGPRAIEALKQNRYSYF